MKPYEVIDIHAHPYFIDRVCTPDVLERQRTVTGYYKHNPFDYRMIENQMRVARVDKMVLHPLDLTSTHGFALCTNEQVRQIVDERPDLFMGFASVDPMKEGAAEELIYAFENLGLMGLKLHPSRQRFFPDDERLEPLYRICDERNKPIMFHAGVSTQPGTWSKYAYPMHFEKVALDHPGLRICLAHFGWPWVREVCMLMMKYPNIYTDTALVYMDSAAEMYQQLFTVDMGKYWVDRSFRHQVMFGSDDPGLEQVRMSRALRHDMPWREQTIGLVMGINALEFLGLKETSYDQA